MVATDVELIVDQLRLRLPHVAPLEARLLVDEVVAHLAERLAAQPSGEWGKLDLKLTLPRGTPRSQIARAIADAILEALRRC
jgi:hypothetical protein